MNLLNLKSIKILSVEETEHDYHIDAESTVKTCHCPHCQSQQIVKHGSKEQMVKDLAIHAKRVAIYLNTKRYRCKTCRKTFMESVPDIDDKRNMTKRLSKWISEQAIKRTFISVAEEVGVTEGTVRHVFNNYINELEAKIRFETPQWMGIDEIYLIKPRGIITNIQNNTAVEILPNRNKDTMLKYLYGLKDRDKVKWVSIDMWRPYKEAVYTALPNATIIIDRFHVVRMANTALDTVRKSLRAELEPKHRRQLKNDRLILLKRKSELTDQQYLIMSGWLANFPKLALAYAAKEAFFDIYEANSLSEANQRYDEWRSMIKPEIEPAFSDLIRAFDNWNVEILNYFRHQTRISNAYTESLNNLIRVMNRLGRGYSFDVLRARILFSEGAHKHKYQKPKFERRSRQIGLMDSFSKSTAVGYCTGYIASEPSVIGNYGSDISTLIEIFEKELKE